jgi:hypothetical protein
MCSNELRQFVHILATIMECVHRTQHFRCADEDNTFLRTVSNQLKRLHGVITLKTTDNIFTADRSLDFTPQLNYIRWLSNNLVCGVTVTLEKLAVFISENKSPVTGVEGSQQYATRSLSWEKMNWIHALPCIFFKIRFNIIIPSMPTYSKLSLPLSLQIILSIFLISTMRPT